MKETISVNSLNKITDNLDIVKVVSEYLTLQRAGKNFKALCPFHEEKTPSFVVNPEKQIFHCFGCGVGGNAIKFLMSIENLPFPQAVALASEKAGVSISLGRYSHKDSEEANKIYNANKFASQIYTNLLFSQTDKRAFEYLAARGLKEPDIKFFQIGYASYSTDLLVKEIHKNKLQIKDFIKAGLVKDDGKADVFRNRVMFPIFDWRGRILGFGGRALDEQQMPKYLNTSENQVFYKGKILYGLNWASVPIKEKDFVILVEGYFDVIKLYLNGIKNVVAPMGTSLTSTQINFFRRYSNNVLLMFDSDQAGVRASLRNLETVLKKGCNTKLCVLPTGFDPDRFIDDYGINPFIELINKSKNFLDFSFDIYSQQHGIETPKGKSLVAKEVMKYIEFLPDAIEKSEYRKILAKKLNIKEEILVQSISVEEKREDDTELNKSDNKLSTIDYTENLIVEILFSDQQYWEKLLEWNGEMTPRISVIKQTSKELLKNNLQLTPSNLIIGVTDTAELDNMSSWITQRALKDVSCFEEEKKQVIFLDCLKKIHKICLWEKLEKVKKEMNTKKDNGLNYNKELEVLQTLLFELQKENVKNG